MRTHIARVIKAVAKAAACDVSVLRICASDGLVARVSAQFLLRMN